MLTYVGQQWGCYSARRWGSVTHGFKDPMVGIADLSGEVSHVYGDRH